MNFSAKSVVASLLLSAVVAAPAFAATDISHSPKALNLVDGTATFSAAFGNNNRNNTFADKFTFSITGGFSTESIVSSISTSSANGLALTGFNLYGASGIVAAGIQKSSGIRDTWVIPTTQLQGGDYWLEVKGYVVSNTSGSFAGNLNVAQAVPEPETYGMMVIGLGLLAGAAMRRKKAANLA